MSATLLSLLLLLHLLVSLILASPESRVSLIVSQHSLHPPPPPPPSRLTWSRPPQTETVPNCRAHTYVILLTHVQTRGITGIATRLPHIYIDFKSSTVALSSHMATVTTDILQSLAMAPPPPMTHAATVPLDHQQGGSGSGSGKDHVSAPELQSPGIKIELFHGQAPTATAAAAAAGTGGCYEDGARPPLAHHSR